MNKPSRPPTGSVPPRPPHAQAPAARPRTGSRTTPAAPITERLKDGAEDTALNAVSLVKEGWRDFLKTNRYFKYKALVVLLWSALALAGIIEAWPEESVHLNEQLGARLVIPPNPDYPAFMIINESDTAWKDVVVIINGEFRGTAVMVEPHSDFTLTPKQLVGKKGNVPPTNLRARDLVVRTRKGEAVLLKDGQQL